MGTLCLYFFNILQYIHGTCMTTYILCILYTDAYEKIYTTKVHYILKTAELKTTQFGIFWQPGAGSKMDEASNGLY